MRGKQATKRILHPDEKYRSVLVAKLINYVMKEGKKSTAERVVYDAFDLISEKTKQNPLEVFESAIRNLAPSVEVRSRRVGGANYQIPTPVRGDRRNALALRWMLAVVRGKKGKPIAQKLATEIIGCANNEGDAMKKKQDVQRMADANRAFAHFARR